MTEKWNEQFAPISSQNLISGRPIEIRTEQALFGQTVINAFTARTNLMAECPVGTGKSIGYLVPLIHAVKSATKGQKWRGAVSTETTALQDQLVKKDLPFLQNIYPNFTFRVLKGRSNYLCMNALRQNAQGNLMAARYLAILEMQLGRIGDGERSDVGRVLGLDLDDKAWSFLAGSPIGCGENSCTPAECYSARARALALQADIVVINHALLRVDADTLLSDDTGMGDNFLGPLKFLVVDEAHTLESVLISGWTEELSEWEINNLAAKVSEGVDAAKTIERNLDIGYKVQQATDNLHDYVKSVISFFGMLHPDEEWGRVTDALCLKTIQTGSSQGMINAMNKYELDGPINLNKTLETLKETKVYLKAAINKAIDQELKGLRPLRKGYRAATDLEKMIRKILIAMQSKDGTVLDYGVPYGVVIEGFTRRDGQRSVRLQIVPLDVSEAAKAIWSNRTCVLVSATLKDLTDGTFNYIAASLGFSEYTELRTGSPFDYAQQQIVYVTPATGTIVDIPGARYSFEELVELLRAADGRSLVLFTARGELDDAAHRLRQLAANGEFQWPILVQETDTNKQQLVEDFRHQEHSVLLATKSFFTGVDFPGNTCSLVVICKFPLPQYNVICRQQINHWRKKGFSRWYEREALTIFQQAAGRLIRAGSDRGVIALLDQRITIPGERVASTARLGVESLSSGVTRSVEDVRTFLQ